jgi:hypothetical protein
VPPLPARAPAPVDLRGLFRSLDHGLVDGPVAVPPFRRHVRMVPELPAQNTQATQPLEIAGACDGIVRRRFLTRCDGRPITLEHVGAAVVAGPRDGLVCEERLYLAGSYLDEGFMREREQLVGIPYVSLPSHCPRSVATDAFTTSDAHRRQLEETVIRATAEPQRVFLVDGSIRRLVDVNGPVVGAVKDVVTTPWLGGLEAELDELPVGWRSDGFLIPAESRLQLDVLSCYLRLDRSRYGWPETGLMRLEVPADRSELLDPFAAFAFVVRRAPTSTDARWQLGPIAHVERVLSARTPQI